MISLNQQKFLTSAGNPENPVNPVYLPSAFDQFPRSVNARIIMSRRVFDAANSANEAIR